MPSMWKINKIPRKSYTNVKIACGFWKFFSLNLVQVSRLKTIHIEIDLSHQTLLPSPLLLRLKFVSSLALPSFLTYIKKHTHTLLPCPSKTQNHQEKGRRTIFLQYSQGKRWSIEEETATATATRRRKMGLWRTKWDFQFIIKWRR